MGTETKRRFLPIIVGTDMNAYTMATSFHEKYGIQSVLVGKLHMHFTMGSTIINDIHYYKDLTDSEAFVTHLKNIADRYHQEYENLILIGTNDIYVNLIITNQEALKEDYTFNYVTPELRDQLFYKKRFYQLCEKHGVDIPHTYFYDCAAREDIPTDFEFPIIVKPSNVVEYQEKGLHVNHKLYIVKSQEELERSIQEVVAGGYKDDLIIQEYIPGDDTYMWDAVYYGNRKGKGQLITLAQVVLQERAPHLIGAYTALIVRHDKEVMDKLVHLMEEIGYQGYGNFDMKYDERDGKLKVFEVNLRQGRSSSYISMCGEHLSEYFVDDLIYHKEKPLTYLNTDFLFSVVSNRVLKTFVKDEKIKKEVKELIKKKHYGNPLLYKKDKGLKRKLRMYLRQVNYYKKYKEHGSTSPFYS